MKNEKLDILFVEDSKICQEAFITLVREEKLNYNYTVVDNVNDTLDLLASNSYDIILADYKLPDGNILEIFDNDLDCPIILITGNGDEEVAVRAMKLGAFDYITKDNKLNFLKVLPYSILNAIKNFKTEKELERYTNEVNKKIKELNTLYKISKLSLTDFTLEQILYNIVDIAPNAMRFPKFANAIIKYDEKIFKTNNYKDNDNKIKADIIMNDYILGYIEIHYNDDKLSFEDYDRDFLNDLSDLISKIIRKKI